MIDHETTALANRLFFRLFQTGNVLQRQVQNEMGLSTVQWAVLGALTRPGYEQGVSFNELTEYLVVSRQNLDGVLKRLERDRHVQRIPHPDDGRARLVILTEQGKVFWDSLQTRIAEFYEQGIVGFGFDEIVALLHSINKLEKNLNQIKIL
ncbi:MarR family winged helix-turn-helix transcriptional regulator [Marinospirillum alkaliphilum]|jgi:DNA-binding MarR family transcriptional regulator|uniref:DNA-binding transcriptional regulator, MarR family n=1 Tax=Marinospirillum alkaliphilum DSM 21637 TaxID=1122209 RepID=A0A1K1VL42_9GAMM|nr:MarR family transcriptional regulator [Marinospirillum alkaliphilum]SFX25862.1 DNA-binding transcriptional regulator, MarR family [Marinospirillum alkaliphilum DSM 21637]